MDKVCLKMKPSEKIAVAASLAMITLLASLLVLMLTVDPQIYVTNFAVAILSIVLGAFSLGFAGIGDPEWKSFSIGRQRFLNILTIVFCGLIIGLLVVSMRVGGHLDTQTQDNLARAERSHIRRLAADQQIYHRQNGDYAGNLASLQLIDPAIADWGHQDWYQLGAADGHGFLISIMGAAANDRISYSLKYIGGSLSTTCDAPEHTGCVSGHWRLHEQAN